jgi:hypothetical protein
VKSKIAHQENTNKICKKSLLIFLGLITSFFSTNVFALEDIPEGRGSDTTFEERLIQGNLMISEWFDSVANGLDVFLVGKRITFRQNESRVVLENATVSVEGEQVTNSTSLGISLRLPNLEAYWSVKFTSYDEQEARRDVKNQYLRQTPRERNVGASVGLLATLGNVKTTFEPRVQLEDPLKISHSLTFESLAQRKIYRVNPKLELYADASDGMGSAQQLNFNFRLTPLYSLTFINSADYKDKTHKYAVTNGLSLGKVINDKASLAYNIIYSSTNQPNYHLEAYNYSISYSQVLYRRILEYQLTPNVEFKNEFGFRAQAGVTLIVTLSF